MKTTVIAAAAVILAAVNLALCRTLPSYIPLCSKNDPNLSNCVRKAATSVLPYIAKGIPELKIPPLEPLEIPTVYLDQGAQAINYKLNLTDLKISGLSSCRFLDMNVDLDRLMINGHILLPEVTIEANYNLVGRVLLLPVRGNGRFIGNANNTKVEIHMQGTLKERDGEPYYESKQTALKLGFDKIHIHLSNLFGGKAIGEATNKIINDNSVQIAKEVSPSIEKLASMLVDDIANKMLTTVTFADLFPEV